MVGLRVLLWKAISILDLRGAVKDWGADNAPGHGDEKAPRSGALKKAWSVYPRSIRSPLAKKYAESRMRKAPQARTMPR